MTPPHTATSSPSVKESAAKNKSKIYDEFIKELEPNRALILPENYFDFWSEDFLKKVSEL